MPEDGAITRTKGCPYDWWYHDPPVTEGADFGIGTSAADIKNAHSLISKVIISINEQVKIQHPEKAFIKGVFGLQINDKPSHPEATVKNICVEALDSEVKIDRSPCGTGTSARMAARHAKGELAILGGRLSVIPDTC